jgi:hypothetical protein
VKTGFDSVGAVVGLLKDVQGVLPAGEKKDAVGASLAEAERHLRTAEAQIAQGLGYKLCRCEFPPHPMLQVGYYFIPGGQRREVHECPVCRVNDAGTLPWQRTAGEGAGQQMPAPRGVPAPRQQPRGAIGSRGGRGSWMAG